MVTSGVGDIDREETQGVFWVTNLARVHGYTGVHRCESHQVVQSCLVHFTRCKLFLDRNISLQGEVQNEQPLGQGQLAVAGACTPALPLSNPSCRTLVGTGPPGSGLGECRAHWLLKEAGNVSSRLQLGDFRGVSASAPAEHSLTGHIMPWASCHHCTWAGLRPQDCPAGSGQEGQLSLTLLRAGPSPTLPGAALVQEATGLDLNRP